MLVMVIALVCALVSVTDFCPPRPPTGTKFQLTDAGETVAEAKQTAAFDAARASDPQIAILRCRSLCFAKEKEGNM